MRKGKLVIAGGNLDQHERRIHGEFLRLGNLVWEDRCIGIVPTASGEDPQRTIDHVRGLWRELGVPESRIMVIPAFSTESPVWPNSAQGDAEDVLSAVERCGAFWFTGGDQLEIAKAFLRRDGTDTASLRRMREMLRLGGVIGGTSAGAAMMSDPMLEGGTNRTALSREMIWIDAERLPDSDEERVLLTRGLGFFREGIVDQHFDVRSRMLRLIRAAHGRSRFGFGVSEDTAMIVDYDGDEIRVLGGGGLYLVDLCAMSTAEAEGNFRFEHVTLSVLGEGDVLRLDRETSGALRGIHIELRKV